MMRKTRVTSAVILSVVLALGASLAVGQSGYDLYQQALQKERAEGKMQEAIQIYQRIVRDFAKDRALAAKALLQLGSCYEKLGVADARKTFEQLVRDYGDQTEVAAEARTRLAALQEAGKPSPAGPVDQLVWVVPAGRLMWGPSQDGRYVPTGNTEFTALWLHDLVTGADRKLIDLEAQQNGGVCYFPAVAPDSKSITYIRAASMYEVNSARGGELWTMDLATGKNRKLVGVDPQHGMGVIASVYSPDSQQIVYDWGGKEDAELRIVSLDGARTHVLTSSRGRAKEPGQYRVFGDEWSRDGKMILASGWRGNNDVPVYSGSRFHALISSR